MPNTLPTIAELKAEFRLILHQVPREQEFPLPAELKSGATLTVGCLERLAVRHRWINDNIIDAYILYLSKLKFRQKEEILAYSTFFYASLQRMCLGNEPFNIRRVQRPKGVNLFEKKYLLFPVNSAHQHWLTVVIVRPDLVKSSLVLQSEEVEAGPQTLKKLTFKEMAGDNNFNRPCIWIMDSLSYDCEFVMKCVRRFLAEEYERLYHIKINLDTMPVLSLDCPQQVNDSDCGVYTLHNIECIFKYMPGKPDLFEWYPEMDTVGRKKWRVLAIFLNIIRQSMPSSEHL